MTATVGGRGEEPPGGAPLPGTEPGGPGAARSAAVAVLVLDPDGLVVSTTPEFEEIFGYPPAEVLGARLSHLVVPERLRATYEAGLRRYRSAGERHGLQSAVEVSAVRRDGTPLTVVATTTPLRGAGRNLVVVTLRVVPDPDTAPEWIRPSADFYKAVLERSPTLVAVINNGITSWYSPAAAQAFDLRDQPAPDAALMSLAHPADHDQVARLLASGPDPGEPIEVRVRGSDGAWHVLAISRRDLSDVPAVAGTAFFAADVTRARTAESGERAAAARLAMLINSLGLGVLVQDEGQRVLAASTPFIDMFGLDVAPAELTGALLDDVAARHGDSVAWRAWQHHARQVERMSPAPVELALPDGRAVEATLAPVDLDGVAVGRLWVFRDVTIAAKARRALSEHNHRLAALSSLKSDFIAIISHELRTPLTSIASFVEMAGPGSGLPATETAAAMAVIERNTERLLALVEDLNLLLNLEADGLVLPGAPVDLAALVRRAVDAVERHTTDVEIRAEVADGPPVSGDEKLLAQLMTAVVGAVASCTSTGPVEVEAWADPLAWSVAAHAPAAQFLTDERMLSTALPVPVDGTRTRSIALSVLLARAITTSHQGTLTMRSEPEGQVSITVRLPIGRPRA